MIEDIKYNIKIILFFLVEILIISIYFILIVGFLFVMDDGLIYFFLKVCIRRVFWLVNIFKKIVIRILYGCLKGRGKWFLLDGM